MNGKIIPSAKPLPPATRRFQLSIQTTVRKLIEGITDRPYERGEVLALKRPLAEREKTLLRDRRAAIEAELKPATAAEIVDDVSRMMAGFGSARATEDEAEIVMTQYVKALQGLPLWAIQDACDRFGNGEVRPDEIDLRPGQKIDPRYAPTTAQLHKVATAAVWHFRTEHDLIVWAQTAVVRVDADRSPGDVEKVRQSLADWHRRIASSSAEEDERRRRIAADQAATSAEFIQREYQHLGVDVERKPKEILTSLSFRLSMGWTVGPCADGTRCVLIAPPK